jgi:DNA-binding SARP family transcriptional activator
MTPLYRFHFFGSPQIEKANQPLSSSSLGSRKGLALLAYLAGHRDAVSRSHLANLFWPDKPEPRGRRNLSRELSQLSTHLPGCLDGNIHDVQFRPGDDYWLDTWDFERLTREINLPDLNNLQDFEETGDTGPTRADLKEAPAPDPAKLIAAVELYRGDFLAGLYLDGCPDFESWLVKEQEYWRRQIIEVLDWLFSYFALRRQDDQARKYLDQWLILEPWNEDPHRYLMILLARNGQRGAALAQYERCRRVLAEELGVEPSAKALTLYEQIRTGELIEKPAPTPPPVREVIEPPGLNLAANKALPPDSPPHNLPAAVKTF